MERQPALDGLRGIGVLLVMLVHLSLVAKHTVVGKVPVLAEFAVIGLDVFFVLSGYLITRLFLTEVDGLGPRRALGRFWLKRAARILPAYVLCLGVCQVLWPQETFWPLWAYLNNYWFIHDQTPHPLRQTWSLAVEEQFYLLWPLVLLAVGALPRWRDGLGKTWARAQLPALVMVGAVGWMLLVRSQGLGQDWVYRDTLCRMLSLAAGAWLATNPSAVVGRRGWLGGMLGFCLVLLLVPRLAAAVQHRVVPIDTILVRQVAYAGASMAIVGLCLAGGWWNALLSWRPLTALGTISYAAYLYHLPIYVGLKISYQNKDAAGGGPWLSALALVLAIAAATVSWFAIERPVLRWVRRRWLSASVEAPADGASKAR